MTQPSETTEPIPAPEPTAPPLPADTVPIQPQGLGSVVQRRADKKAKIAEMLRGQAKGEAPESAAEPGAQDVSGAGDAPAPEDGTEPTGAEATEATEDKAEKTEEKDKPKAAEWAQLKKAKATIAKREREVKREREELTQLKADLQTTQQELADLNKLMGENPLEFIKKVGGGDVRNVFKAALAEEEVDEGEARLRSLEGMLKQQAEELAAYKEAEEKRRREYEEQSKKTEIQQYHDRNVRSVKEKFEEHTKPEDFPYLHAYNHDLVSRQVYAKVWKHYQETGLDLDLYDAFDQVNTELQQLVEPFKGVLGAGQPPAPPTRGTGAVTEPAKPEAEARPAPPPTLQASATTARTVGDRRLSREERLARAAAKLRKVG